jgi:hypothetical protein
MFYNLHPKCANPACASEFSWLKGGKLFRFHRDPPTLPTVDGTECRTNTFHHVEHFWLCERCSHIFTLGYESGRGVVIRLLWPQLPAADNTMHLPAS